MFARRARFEQADLRAALAQESPDVVLVDFNCWGAAAVAERSGIAWGRWCSYPLPLPSRDAPPFGPGLPPARGRLGHLRDRMLSPLITGGFERVILPHVNEVRTQQGLAPLSSITDIVIAAPLVLSMTAEPFEVPALGLAAVGPAYRSVCVGTASRAPPWLEQVDRPSCS